MLQLTNKTPFDSQIMLTSDKNGADVVVLGVKATFSILPEVAIAKEQVPLILEDQYLGDPLTTSLKYASEMLMPKPGADLVLNGHAYAPNGQKTGVVDTLLSVGQLSKTLRVFGDRLWIHGGQSEPQTFEKIPLIYENAYGGVHHFQPDKPIAADSALAVSENPIGKGFIGKRSNKDMIGQHLPNIEDPRQLIRTPYDKPRPTGYGYIPSSWAPRKNFAGTYDQQWTKTRAPFLPTDFDERFFLSGSEGLSLERQTFKGGEAVRLINLMEGYADVQCHLPVCPLSAKFKFEMQWHDADMPIETILIEPDENRLIIIWKTHFLCNKKPLKVSEVSVSFDQDIDQTGVN